MTAARPYRPPSSSPAAADPGSAFAGTPRRERTPGPHAYMPLPEDGGVPDAKQRLRDAEHATQLEGQRLRAKQDDLQALQERYTETIALLDQTVARAEVVLARDAVAVGMLVAEEILGHTLRVDAKAVADLVHAALREVPEEPGTRVRVSPDDLPRIELVLAGTRRAGLSVVAEPELGPGDCVVESPSLVIDARLRDKMHAIAEALTDAIAADERLPTHDEVSLEDEMPSIIDAPPPKPADGGPEAISLDAADEGGESC